MTFGQRIKELRSQHSLTQRQLAEQANVDFTYLSKIENDRLEHTPSIKTIQDLARALEVDELELMDLANKVPPLLAAIARNKDAIRFFRRATETVKTSAGWRDLLLYLEQHSDHGVRRREENDRLRLGMEKRTKGRVGTRGLRVPSVISYGQTGR